MIDTIRFRGINSHFNLPINFTKYIVYKKDNREDFVPVISGNDNQKKYRLFYNPGTQVVDIELSIPKLIFNGKNFFNYCINPYQADSLLRSIGNTFFMPSSYYITRIDIGGVHLYDNRETADKDLEAFRKSRPKSRSVTQYKHQNYKTSVFYHSKSSSIKIYNKGAEYFKNTKASIDEDTRFDLYRLNRFEKTYRLSALTRLRHPTYTQKNKKYWFQKEKNFGIHIDEFHISPIYADFYETFTDWDKSIDVPQTELTRTNGLLHLLDQQGLLHEVENSGIVSRSTIHRYRKTVKDYSKTDYIKNKFIYNLPKKYEIALQTVINFGASHII